MHVSRFYLNNCFGFVSDILPYSLSDIWHSHLASGILSDIFCDIFWHSIWHFSCMLSDMYLGMLYVILLRFGLGFAFLVHIIFFRFIEVACKPCHNGMIMTLSYFPPDIFADILLTYTLAFYIWHFISHTFGQFNYHMFSGHFSVIWCGILFWHCIWQGGCKLSARPREPVGMGRRTRRRRRRRRSNLT